MKYIYVVCFVTGNPIAAFDTKEQAQKYCAINDPNYWTIEEVPYLS